MFGITASYRASRQVNSRDLVGFAANLTVNREISLPRMYGCFRVIAKLTGATRLKEEFRAKSQSTHEAAPVCGAKIRLGKDGPTLRLCTTPSCKRRHETVTSL